MDQDHHLIRYLLGELDEDETRALDEQALADDRLAERLAWVEDDVVDAYVQGDFEDDQAERFVARFMASDAGRERVAFARSLARHAGQAGREVAITSPPVSRKDQGAGEPTPRRRALPRRPLLAWAALLVIGLGAGWWAFQAQRVAAPATPSVLLIPEVRGTDTVPRVVLPTDAETLTLTVDLEGVTLTPPPGDARLVAEVRDAAGDIRWQARDLHARNTGRVPSLIIALPAGGLEPGRYDLTLEQISADGTQRPIGAYGFVIDAPRSTP